jgi:DNA-binding response OmpR family regulator
MMRKALVVFAEKTKGNKIIDALESEHEIWHVARQRDAIAWLDHHRPDIVAIDLDLDGADSLPLLEKVRAFEEAEPLIVIGFSKKPSALSEKIASRIDVLVE